MIINYKRAWNYTRGKVTNIDIVNETPIIEVQNNRTKIRESFAIASAIEMPKIGENIRFVKSDEELYHNGDYYEFINKVRVLKGDVYKISESKSRSKTMSIASLH